MIGLADRVAWEGLKLPVVFVDDEPVLTGKIDESAISEVLFEKGLQLVI